MLTVETARKLKAAGLEWHPALHDFFAIPDHGLDERIFVIADLPANLAVFQGQQVFTFEGAAEWAMDYIVTTEAVWLPTESQLRQAVEARTPDAPILLSISPDGYECSIVFRPEAAVSFRATSAEEAYAQALLFLLQRQRSTSA
jgi:hypothetical protein